MAKILEKTKQSCNEYFNIVEVKTMEIEMVIFLGKSLDEANLQRINKQFSRIVKGLSNRSITAINYINVKKFYKLHE